jgi:predicted dehydrogenase
VAVVGVGSVGRRHARNLLACGADVVLCRPTAASVLPEDLAHLTTVGSLDEALALEPAGVVVATPTADHPVTALAALRRGCAVLLEKPVAPDLRHAPDLLSAAAGASGQVLVGYQFRFHPTLAAARELVADGHLGRIVHVRAHWGEHLPDWHPWEDYRGGYAARSDLGGGALLTLSHVLDSLRWLVGEIDRVHGTVAHVSPLELDVDDVAELVLGFAGGALGSCTMNLVQRPPQHWIEVIGTAGTLRWDAADGELVVRTTGSPFGAPTTAPVTEVRRSVPEGFERNDLFVAEARHFLDVIGGAAAPRCDLGDGLRVVEICERARSTGVGR